MKRLLAFHRHGLPAPAALLLSLGEGILIGIFLHYILYRLSLPGAPFIYVSF